MNNNKKYLIGTIGFFIGCGILILIIEHFNLDPEKIGALQSGFISPAIFGGAIGYWFWFGRHNHKKNLYSDVKGGYSCDIKQKNRF